MAQILRGPGARAPPPLPDHLFEEILVRIASPADLARASAACATFRRLVADASFLRHYRSLHPPLLLGVLVAGRFLPVEDHHPNALTADALIVSAADLSLEHLPPRLGTGWIYSDARDGRLLLMCSQHAGGDILPDLAVRDPLTRRCRMLPPIPQSLVASVLVPVRNDHVVNFVAFFVPGADYEEAQFRVIAWTYCGALAVAFVYSSLSGTWTDGTSISLDAPGFQGIQALDLWPSYAYGCFYWQLQFCNKLLKLDVNMMEFSALGLPPNHENRMVVVVEAGEGRIGIITRIINRGTPVLLRYYIWQNAGGNDVDNGHMMETTIPLPRDYGRYFVFGAAEGYIVLLLALAEFYPKRLVFFSLNIKTLEIVRLCSTCVGIDYHCYTPLLYFGYPPFMSPRRI